MDREEAIRIYKWLANPRIKEAFEFFAPELAESEDERVRKNIVAYLKYERKSTQEEINEVFIPWLEKQKEMPTNEEMLRTLRAEYEKGVADTIAKYEQKEQKSKEDIIGKAMSYFGAESLLDNANGLSDFEKFTAWLYCEFLRGLPKKLNQEYIKEQTKVILDAAQKELCKMPDSTKLLEMWDAEKDMLQEKDFRGDTWRIAQNAYMDGFARGTCVKFEKQKEKGRNITANLLEDGITGVQRELIEFLANNIDASWVDVIKSADAYAHRIRSMFEKQKEQKPNISDEAIREGVAHFGITQYQINNWLKKHINVIEQKPQDQSVDVIKMSALLAADRLASAEMTGRLKERKEILENPEKYGLCKPAEWSEEDKTFVKDAIEAVENYYSKGCGQEELVSWLKSLRPQPKIEWGEEDENVIETLIQALQLNAQFEFAVTKIGLNHVQTHIVLDKYRRLYPQPHWKPSEEQMEALHNACYAPELEVYGAMTSWLKELYEQLKKLI